MKVLVSQFLGKNMSWSIVGWELARSLIKMGHEVHLFSTDGIKHLPEDLKNNLIGYVEENQPNIVFGKSPDSNYEMQISYTAMKNFPNRLQYGSKNRFGIWCYEFGGKNSLPTGFAKYYKYTDKLLPPSNFAKQVFLDSGIPEEAMTVVPHGINLKDLKAELIQLKTNKKNKILINVTQIHIRKNLSGTLDAVGKAFTNKDDVCIILKVSDKPPTQPFELSIKNLINNFKNKFKNHPEIEIIKEFVPNIYSLYKACNIALSLSHSECFGMTALEAKSVGLINIAPNYGGFLDFLNDENSLLVNGKEILAPPQAMYWESKPGTRYFLPSTDDAVDKLKYAVNNSDKLITSFNTDIKFIHDNYNWESISNQILRLAN